MVAAVNYSNLGPLLAMQYLEQVDREKFFFNSLVLLAFQAYLLQWEEIHTFLPTLSQCQVTKSRGLGTLLFLLIEQKTSF